MAGNCGLNLYSVLPKNSKSGLGQILEHHFSGGGWVGGGGWGGGVEVERMALFGIKHT